MACRISELVLDCRDPEMLARFWCEVLDFIELGREEGQEGYAIEIGPREEFGGPQPTIILRSGNEPEHGKPRLHIDVNPTDRDQEAELERLLKLGPVRPTSARPARSNGRSSPTPKATRSVCSRPASTHSESQSRQAVRHALEVPR